MAAKHQVAALVSTNGYPTIKVETSMVLVGRSPDCDVIVDSKRVSRRHCCLALVNVQLHVKDLGSTNGCWWEGARNEDFTVLEGQEFAIGDASYRFYWDHPSDQVMLPGSREREANLDRSNGPRSVSDQAARQNPESSDPFFPIAGLA